MKLLKGWLDNGHVTLETTISKVIITWMGWLENDGIMIHQLRLQLVLFYRVCKLEKGHDMTNTMVLIDTWLKL